MAGEIFISYRRSDQAKARLLHALLKQRGVDAWYDAHVGAGEDWRRATAKALDAAPIFVLLFSKNASESDDIGKELAAATFSKKLVIPVRIEDIKPSGEFLYELASRNWFDAFEDTEARFEVLADKLAAMVKGGPAADVAAFSLGAPQPAPKIEQAATSLLKRPLVRGGLAVAALAVVAAVAMFAMRPQASSAAASSAAQRIAFFGFTAEGDDPVASEMARTATDETFATLDVMQLQTVARGAAESAPPNTQLEQAKSLGARYALGGAVRKQGQTYAISVQLDDASLGEALWQKTMPAGTAAQQLSLTTQAAAEATRAAQCFVGYRQKLEPEPETEQILTLLRRVCANPERNPELIRALRELSRAAPRSAYVGAQFAGFQLALLPQVPLAERAARIDESRQAWVRANKIDPGEPYGVQAEALLGYADGRALREIEVLLRDALDKSQDAFILLVALRDLMHGVGRHQEALIYAERARQRDPMNTTAKRTTARLLLQTGRPSEAYALFKANVESFPTSQNWLEWVMGAAFAPGADVARALKARPAAVSDETFDCARDVAAAVASSNPRIRNQGAARLHACGAAAGVVIDSIYILPALGDIDGGLASAQAIDRTTPLAYLTAGNPMFYRAARPMREDSRFKQMAIDHGLWQYWIDSKTMPDVCNSAEERDSAFCSGLRAAQAGK